MAFIRTNSNYINKKAKTKQYVPKNESGNSGVRAAMTNMGMDNSKIGWKDGAVTYNHQSFKPSSVEDGVSYAPMSDIQDFVNGIYKAEGKNPMRATDYVAPAGLGDISYSDNGMVSVGGENIPVLYMDGDRAVVDENDLNKAYAKLMNNLGMQKSEDMYDDWYGKFGSNLRDAYADLTSDKPWSYNPETDPAYQAYSNMYRREGERAYRDAAAKMATKNNGNMTSAAQTLANQQMLYYMSQLADRIPELAKNSYDRYKNEHAMKREAYDLLANSADSDWNKRTDMQKMAREDYKQASEAETKRDERLYNRWANEFKKQDNDDKLAENDRNAQKDVMDIAWNEAEKRGYFTDTEAQLWNIPKKEDGTYMTPNDIKIYNDKQYFNEATKPELNYKSDLTINELKEKYGLMDQNDAKKAARNYSNQVKLAGVKSAKSLYNSKELARYKNALKGSTAKQK